MPKHRHLQAIKSTTGLWGIFLICFGVLLGGCGSPEPRLSPEAQTLKKEVLAEINYLTDRLIEPVSSRDWEGIKPILQASYENIKETGQPTPLELVVMDANAITRVRFPSEFVRHFDFSRYKPAKTVFNKKRKVQAALFLKDSKIYLVLAPLLQKDKVIGALALSFSQEDLQEKWNVSEEEFLSLDFNQ